MGSNSLVTGNRVNRPAALGTDRAGTAERWATMMGGTALGLIGARRGRWSGAALAACGAGLFLAGALGVPLSKTWRTTKPIIRGGHRTPERTQAVVTIAAPAETIYQFWRNFANLPKLMPYLERVDVLSAVESQWVAKARGADAPLRWRVVLDRIDENQLLTWHTGSGTALPHRASLMLKPAPGDRGTEVRLTLVHRVPPAEVARLLGVTPERQARDALLRLKQRIETGEQSTVDRQPHGDRGLRPHGDRGARGMME